MALSAVKIQRVSVSKVPFSSLAFVLQATVKCWQIITTGVIVMILFYKTCQSSVCCVLSFTILCKKKIYILGDCQQKFTFMEAVVYCSFVLFNFTSQ